MSHHPQDHFDAGSIAFASNADCDRATVLFSQLANALQSEQLKNREAADALDAQAERIKALEGDVTNRQAALIVTQSKRIVELEGALRGIMPYWTHAWDLVEGGLFIDKQSVKKFDAAFQRARALLEGK